MIIFFSLRVLFFSSLSCDRSFTPTHPGYYSPKHESMMEEMLSCQQVKHGTQHTNQSGGSRPSFFSFFLCVLTHWKFRVMTWTETTTTTTLQLHHFVCVLSRCRRFPERMSGTHIVLAGAQRTWITWLYPPAPFTLGTCIHPGINYTQQDIVMNEHVLRCNLFFPDKSVYIKKRYSALFTF